MLKKLIALSFLLSYNAYSKIPVYPFQGSMGGKAPMSGFFMGEVPERVNPKKPFMGHGPAIFRGGKDIPKSNHITEKERGKILHLAMELKKIEEDTARLLSRGKVLRHVENILHEAQRQLLELAQGQPQHTPAMRPMAAKSVTVK